MPNHDADPSTTEQGEAAILGFNFEKQDVKWEVIHHDRSPIDAAHAFIESIRDEWPGYVWTVVGDEKAIAARQAFLVPKVTT